MNEKYQKRKDFAIENSVCIFCQKNSPQKDKLMCFNCYLEKSELQKKRYVVRAPILRKKRLKEGVCVRCGKNKPKEKCLSCAICIFNANKKKRPKMAVQRFCEVCSVKIFRNMKYCKTCGERRKKDRLNIRMRQKYKMEKERSSFLLKNPSELEKIRKKIMEEV